MQEAWIDLVCPACNEDWEANPSDLPAADEDFTCQHCSETRPMAEFTQTARDLEILEEFHQE